MARRRVVRKQPLGARLATLPFDLWLSVSEAVELIDWDSHAKQLALPAGLGCDFLLLICRLYATYSRSEQRESLFLSDDNIPGIPRRKPLLTVMFSTLTASLLILCIANTVYTIKKSKKYTLMGRDLDNAPDTPSAYKGNYESPNVLGQSPLKKILNWQASSEPTSDDQVWELSIWDPSKFSLFLSCSFSPLHVFAIMYGPANGFTFLLIVALSASLFGLVYKFTVQSKDRAILHSEVLGEYGKKVVQPTLYTQKRDVAVGTDGSVELYTASPAKHYTTHDLKDSRRQSMRLTQASPWASPVRPTSSLASSNQSSVLRQRASFNSIKLQPTATPISRSRPWKRDPSELHASPLSKK